NDTNSKIPTKKYYYGTESISTSILPDYSNSYVTLAGDIDCDGRISVSDVLALKKYLAKSNVDISIVNANVNKDDKIDLLDLARLKVIYINM
ncbi:MAG: dockerin type I repeat-containing protein, partial [Clostridia bacterium]|nr:dockerin type I repeat-containing protein [Clostridia bacterium]